MIVGIKKFHQYLYGQEFTMYTDHKPLLGLLGEKKAISPMTSARIQRWILFLAGYQCTLCYRPGSENGNADALSRLPLPELGNEEETPEEVIMTMKVLATTPIRATDIERLTGKDPTLARVRNFVWHGWPKERTDDPEIQPYPKRRDELSIVDRCILWGSRVVVPPTVRKTILDELHEGHPGISRMRSLARSYVWWPRMDEEIAETVQNCTTCQQHQKPPAEAPLHPWEWPDRPWSRLHMDFAGPFMGKMFLIVIDAHSKWLEVLPMTKITAEETIAKVRQLISTHGLPEIIVTDNGATFTSAEFRSYLDKNGVTLIHTAPYHPASNGLAERAVQIFTNGLKKMENDRDGGRLEDRLARFLFSYRATPQSTTGTSPGELLMGRRMRSKLDLLHPDLSQTVRRRQGAQKEAHDRTSRERLFEVGQQVYARNFGHGPLWLEGTIQNCTGPVSFKILLTDGRVWRRHIDHIRRCYRQSTDLNRQT